MNWKQSFPKCLLFECREGWGSLARPLSLFNLERLLYRRCWVVVGVTRLESRDHAITSGREVHQITRYCALTRSAETNNQTRGRARGNSKIGVGYDVVRNCRESDGLVRLCNTERLRYGRCRIVR